MIDHPAAAVRCLDCARFIPNARNPGVGMGTCRVEHWQKTRLEYDGKAFPPYPLSKRFCNKFKAK